MGLFAQERSITGFYPYERKWLRLASEKSLHLWLIVTGRYCEYFGQVDPGMDFYGLR